MNKGDRALDILMAERVMGWPRWDMEAGDWPGPDDATFYADFGDECGLAVYVASDEPTFYFAPSAEIKDAWRVVERMMALDFWPTLNYLCGEAEPLDKPAWFARFRCVRGGTRGDHWATADTAYLAVCLAARKAFDD